MLPKEELQDIAETKGLSLRNTEQDYLLDICLHVISKYRKALVFKGGTALYKFHSLNRFSEGLDFVLNKGTFDFDKMKDQIIRSSDFLNIGAQVGEEKRFQQEINLSLMFRGPLYTGIKESLTRVSFNISRRERAQTLECQLYIPPYKELPSFELYILSSMELLAEKIRAIMTRNKPRDVYDTWFLLRKGVELDIDMINTKLKIYNKRFSRDKFHDAIEIKRGLWNRDLSGLMIGRTPDFDKTVDDIKKLSSMP